jgi:TolB-like protein/Tfp pilus assembly protein PilF
MTDRNFFAELKRRNVLRAGAFYAAGAWLLVQVATQVFPFFHIPEWIVRWIVVAATVGFPFWLLFAWYYEWTPQGLQRESEIPVPTTPVARQQRKNTDRWIIAMLTVAVVLLLANQFVGHRAETPSASVSDTPKESIAVLPFLDMSEAKDQGYFSDGISEELLNVLAKIPQLKVAARTSSFSFKGKQVEIPEIARQLHVANVLEGSVRKSGNQLRITAQLINAAEGYHLWSETYDRKLDDIFAIQDEIAKAVVEQLKVTLLGAAPKVRKTDPEAYALYLQASHLGGQSTAEAFHQSDELLHKVVAIDPNYAPAWDKLAANSINATNILVLSTEEGYARAREAEQKALTIDPEYAPAYARLGYIAMSYDNDLAAAARHFEHALTLDPTNNDVLGNAASFLAFLGRLDQALVLQEMVVRRDPVSLTALYSLGGVQRFAGRSDAAIASYQSVLRLSPGRGGAHFNLGVALLLKGDASAALTEMEHEPAENWRMIGLPLALHALGRKADSDQALVALISKYEKEWSYNIAYVYAYRGEADKAFEWLDKAIEYKDSGLGEIVPEILFAKIRGDPRWVPFLRKIGKAPDQLGKIEFKVTLPPSS